MSKILPKFQNGKREYTCPITALPIIELENFTEVQVAENYFFTIRKIGNNILHVNNRGENKYFDITRHYTLLERFAAETGVTKPFIEIRDYTYLKGKASNRSIRAQKKYFQVHEADFAGVIFLRAPFWVRTLVKAALTTFETSIPVVFAENYTNTVTAALNLLAHQKPDANSELNFANIHFDPALDYKNPESGLHYKCGFIPGKVFYSSIQGNVNNRDIQVVTTLLQIIHEKGEFKNTNPYWIVDYSQAGKAPVMVRKKFIKPALDVLKKYNCHPKATFVCGTNLFNKAMIGALTAILKLEVYFVASVEEAFARIESKALHLPAEPENFTISQQEINTLIKQSSVLFWEEEDTPDSVHEHRIFSADHLGQIEETLAVAKSDIMDLRKADAQNAKYLTDIFEAIQVGLMIIDTETSNIVFANKAAAEMVQMSQNHLTGNKCHNFICQAEKGHCPVMDSGKKMEQKEEVLLRSDGSSCPVLKTVIPFQFRGRPCLLETYIDITEMKKAEIDRERYLGELEENKKNLLKYIGEVERAEKKFRTVFDSNNDAVMLFDGEVLLDCNPATLKMFGCETKEEFAASRLEELFPQKQPDGLDSRTFMEINKAITIKNGVHRFEAVHKKLDTGDEFPAEVILYNVEIDGRQVVQAIVRDITRRKFLKKESGRAKNGSVISVPAWPTGSGKSMPRAVTPIAPKRQRKFSATAQMN